MLTLRKRTPEWYDVLGDGRALGEVRLYTNRHHSTHAQVKLALAEYRPQDSMALFEALVQDDPRPMQVSISSEDAAQADFLRAGGFVLKRRCYEEQIHQGDLLPGGKVELLHAERGEPMWEQCCRRIYRHYIATHNDVSPLTAGFAEFCGNMPQEAYYALAGGSLIAAALTEAAEIAYITARDEAALDGFAHALAARLLADYGLALYECDDCDWAAMRLRAVFGASAEESWDTWIRPHSLRQSAERMVARIADALADCKPSIYLYGSVAMDDFRLGWSDIDLLVLTQREIPQEAAERLVGLRQEMLAQEPGNPFYRSFEGAMLPLDAFRAGAPARVVYWGTSGQRITDRYRFDSFCMAELLTGGMLLHGEDVRGALAMPDIDALRRDVQAHYETIRQHGSATGRSLYAYGWLLDISRCLYTLKTGKIVSKTAAGQWVLGLGLCPVPDALQDALRVRQNPMKWKEHPGTWDRAEMLGDEIQRYADVLAQALAEE